MGFIKNTMNLNCLVVFSFSLFFACASKIPQKVVVRSHEGFASWYGPSFHGKKTASGEIYDMHAFTAAHPTLPFQTLVRVFSNDAFVDVLINDRGPFVKGRILDLSYAAAKQLKVLHKGSAWVRLEVLAPAASPQFQLQFGSFSDEKNALQLKARLMTLGIAPIDVTPIKKAHRVVSNLIMTEPEAMTLKAKFKKLGFDSLLLHPQ